MNVKLLALTGLAFTFVAGAAYAQHGPPFVAPPIAAPPIVTPGPPTTMPPVAAPPVATPPVTTGAPTDPGADASAFGQGVAAVAQDTHDGAAVRDAALANGHAADEATDDDHGPD
jgi:hypothetical protein